MGTPGLEPLRLISKSCIFAINMNHGTLAETAELGKIDASIQKSLNVANTVEDYCRGYALQVFSYAGFYFFLEMMQIAFEY